MIVSEKIIKHNTLKIYTKTKKKNLNDIKEKEVILLEWYNYNTNKFNYSQTRCHKK